MENTQTQPFYMIDAANQNPNIHHKSYKTDKHEYNILTYDKNMICNDDFESAKYRSVVFSQERLVSFAPPKSIPKDQFIKKYSDNGVQIPNTIHITETIEGTMINLFYDFPNQTWELATKNAVGGRYWYFRNNGPPRTFRDMFMDAIGEEDYADLNQTKLVANLPTDCCYSFVLQHPENHFVHEVDQARLFLVAVYQIQGDVARYLSLPYVSNLTVIRELLDENIMYLPTTIQYFAQMHYKTFDQILCDGGFAKSPKTYAELEQHLNTSASYAHMMGLTLINTETGERTKLENQQYNYKKQLRGNHPNLQYQYLCLWRIQQIPEFLKHFPVYRESFDRFEAQLDQFVNNIQTTYYMYYIRKQQDVEFSRHIMYFVRRIHHELFIASLNTPNRVIITRPVVRDWLMRSFEPGALLYHMNIPIIVEGCA